MVAVPSWLSQVPDVKSDEVAVAVAAAEARAGRPLEVVTAPEAVGAALRVLVAEGSDSEGGETD